MFELPWLRYIGWWEDSEVRDRRRWLANMVQFFR